VEVRAHEEQAGELALAAGGGLQADRCKAGYLEEDLLEVPLELEGALDGVFAGERVEVAETWEADEPLVDTRVVLHRARAERVETGVDPEVARRELCEVAHDLRLGKLRKTRRGLAGELRGDGGHRQAGVGRLEAAPSGTGALVDEPGRHGTSASTSRSI